MNRQRREDRISALPDEILSQILCRLPCTKTAVRTSVLSRRWLNVCTNLPLLYLDYTYYDRKKYYDIDAFIRIVDKLLCRNASSNLKKCILDYNNYGNNDKKCLIFRVNDWVQSALLRNVINLDLRLMFSSERDEYCTCGKVGLWLSRCHLLQVLRIETDVPLRMSSFRCFHNLKKFYIELVLADNEVTSKLFSYLPKLEELSIAMSRGNQECRDVNIIAPVLKVLHFSVDSGHMRHLNVLIDAPMLKDISITDGVFHSYTFRETSSIVRINVNVGRIFYFLSDYNDFDHGIELIRGLTSAKSLSISKTTMMAKSIVRADDLPMFHNLTKLKLFFVDLSLWNLFLHFVRNAPNLEILVLEMSNMEEEENVDMSQTCPMVHLKEVEITGNSKIQRLQLLKFFMKNAEFLKKFKVNSVEFI